jgi:hypothetical protein
MESPETPRLASVEDTSIIPIVVAVGAGTAVVEGASISVMGYSVVAFAKGAMAAAAEA